MVSGVNDRRRVPHIVVSNGIEPGDGKRRGVAAVPGLTCSGEGCTHLTRTDQVMAKM